VDVASEPWTQGVVALQVMNQIACTGTLLNNSAGDGRPLLLTAAHCHQLDGQVVDPSTAASSLRVAWGATSACGQALPAAFSVASAVTEGARHRAEYGDTWLVELVSAPPTVAQAWWTGFDANDTAASGGVTSLHHGSGLARQALQTTATPLSVVLNGVFNGVFGLLAWQVTPQAGGASPGASGAALLDHQGRIVGTLSTGSSCSATSAGTLNYAKLAPAWTGDGTTAGSLRAWLDPLGLGRQLDGRNSTGVASTPLTTPLSGDASSAAAVSVGQDGSSGGGGGAMGWWLLLLCGGAAMVRCIRRSPGAAGRSAR
jgi:hypothetical protein